MTYKRKVWKDGDLIVADNLNNIEEGISEALDDTKENASKISQEKAERMAENSVLNARMNTFTAMPEGGMSTAAEAELHDIRVGPDGTVYPTAGEAVRGQVGKLSEAIDKQSEEIDRIKDTVEPLKTHVIITSDNILNPNNYSERGVWYFEGKKYTTGNTYTDNSKSIVLDVSEGETYYIGVYSLDGTISNGNNKAIYGTAFDEDENHVPLSVEQNITGSVTIPSGGKKLALTFMIYNSASATDPVYNVLISKKPIPNTFEAYAEKIVGSIENRVAELENVVDRDINIILPEKLYCVVGEELNIYFDNILNVDYKEVDIDVTCSKGQQFDRFYRLSADAIGDFDISISVAKNGKIVCATSTIIVTNANTSNEKDVKVLVIGDSTTNGGVVINKLYNNAVNKRVSVTALGTRGDGAYKHEGRSGWTANYYANLQTDGTYTNAFYNPESSGFDFWYYRTHNSIDRPDMVIINLGINDVFSATNDEELLTMIDSYVSNVELMIARIKADSPNCKIGIATTIPPNYSQDSFGKSYECGQTRKRYKKNNYELVSRIISKYENRESGNIYLLPIYTNLDTVYNMYMEDTPANKRSDITYKSPTGYGCVHPDNSGLWQIADVYWFAINAIF